MRKFKWLWSVAACLLLAALAGCAEGRAPNSAIPPPATPAAMEPVEALPVPKQGGESNPTPAAGLEVKPDSNQPSPLEELIAVLTPVTVEDDPLADQILGRASADLAAKLSVDEKDIQLSGMSAVTWPDASLGCPEPDKVYSAALTPGYQVVLEFAGKSYVYHTDRGQAMIYCEGQKLNFPKVWDEDATVQRARLDLSHRLGIPIDEITVSTVLGQEFSAQAFQCQKVKERITRDENPAVIFGKAILLVAGGQKYLYHADGQQVIFCRVLK